MGRGISVSFTAERIALKSLGQETVACGTQCSSTWVTWNHLWGSVPGGMLPWGLKQTCARCGCCGSSSSKSETSSLTHAVSWAISSEALTSLLCCWLFTWTSEPGVWGDVRQIYLRKNTEVINGRKSLQIILVVRLVMIKSGLDMPPRFVASLRLEKTCKIVWSNCQHIPTMPTDRVPQYSSSLFLHTSRDADSTTFVGSPFQCLTAFSCSFRNSKLLFYFLSLSVLILLLQYLAYHALKQ